LNFFSLYKRAFLYKIKKKINIDTQSFDENISLEKLFSLYKTDKANFYNNTYGHGYTRFYETYLEKLRNKNLKILEIGSFSGSSAASFIKYFPNAEVFCVDVNISNFVYSSKKIHVFGADIINKKEIMKLLNQIKKTYNFDLFDVIIDDGSHKLFDMLFTLNILYEYVIKDGYYIIEDYKLAEMHEHLNDPSEIFISTLINKLKNNEQFESNIIQNQSRELLLKTVGSVNCHKGNLDTSDIVFIKKK
jgi:predicted O-methyltransferase YrrM